MSKISNSNPEVKIIFNEQEIQLVDETVSSLEFAKKIINDYAKIKKEDPFFVMDVGEVLKHHNNWMKNLPRVKPYYAVKCNNNPVLLAILAHVGCSFDCASLNEIEKILSLGVDPKRIIYANPIKTPSFIQAASSKGVRMMTFDNETEMMKIHKYHPHAELVLRIAVSDATASCQLSSKFGCNPESEAPLILKQAADVGSNVVGISFHVGSGCHNPAAYAEAIEFARHLFDVGLSFGHRMNILDIGGGFPGVNDAQISLEKIAKVVNDSLNQYFHPNNNIKIIGEPGRYYAASAFTLCTNIIGRHNVSAYRITKNETDKSVKGYMYYINDGIYGSFNNIVFDHAVPHPITLKDSKSEMFWSEVWGPTCDSIDCVLPKCKLPLMEEGEWLIFDKMGAYTLVASSEFNGFQRPDCFYIVTRTDAEILSKAIRCSLSREEPHSTVQLLVIPKMFLRENIVEEDLNEG